MTTSFTLAIQNTIDRHDLNRPDVMKYLHRQMCHQLADKLIENCEMFDRSDSFKPFKTYCIEITVNDRGSYEHIVESAKYQARKEGYLSGKKDQIYGFEIDYDM